MRLNFTDEEQSLIVQALQEKASDDLVRARGLRGAAGRIETNERLAAAFEMQAKSARDLADKIENEICE